MRGKVDSIKAFEPEVPEYLREEALTKAERYFKLSLRYSLLGSRPALLIVFGVIGSGKSTLADAVSKELSCPVISSDILRKELTGMEPYERKYEDYDSGIYAPEITETTYEELIGRGIEIVNTGAPALIDASFSKRKWREHVRTSSKYGIPVYFIQTLAPESVIRERLLKRELEGASVSDARLEILERFTKEFEEPQELFGDNLIPVDTTVDSRTQLGDLFQNLIKINLEPAHEHQ